jgi:MarR family transcriptional regulator, organic hydroperoxide resistance regulator
MMVSRQSMTAVLDRLEAARLTGRLRTEGDGRLRHVLTPNGAKTWTGEALARRWRCTADALH